MLTIYTKGCSKIAQGNAHPITQQFTQKFLDSVNKKLNNTAVTVHYCYLPYKVQTGKNTVTCYINALLIDATEQNIQEFSKESNNIALKGTLISLLADKTPTNQDIRPEYLPSSVDKAGFNQYDLFLVVDFKQNDSFVVTSEEKIGSIFEAKNVLFNYGYQETAFNFQQLGQSQLKKAKFSTISGIYNKDASAEENKLAQTKINGEVIMPLVDNDEPVFEGKATSSGNKMIKVNVKGDFVRTVSQGKDKLYINSAIRVLLLNNTDHNIEEYEFQPTAFVDYSGLDTTPRANKGSLPAGAVEVDDDEIPF